MGRLAEAVAVKFDWPRLGWHDFEPFLPGIEVRRDNGVITRIDFTEANRLAARRNLDDGCYWCNVMGHAMFCGCDCHRPPAMFDRDGRTPGRNGSEGEP